MIENGCKIISLTYINKYSIPYWLLNLIKHLFIIYWNDQHTCAVLNCIFWFFCVWVSFLFLSSISWHAYPMVRLPIHWLMDIRLVFGFSFLLFWLRWVPLAECRLSLAVVSGGYSSWSVWASQYGGFSCCIEQVLGLRASVVTAHRLRSCG